MDKGASASTSGDNLLQKESDKSAIEAPTVAASIVTFKTDTVIQQGVMNFLTVEGNAISAVKEKQVSFSQYAT